MKCPRCNGKRCEPDNSGDLVWRACKMCHGTGIVPDNNEYWFCSLSTEEKADFLADLYPKSAGEALIKISNGDKERWLEWLKQPHKE